MGFRLHLLSLKHTIKTSEPRSVKHLDCGFCTSAAKPDAGGECGFPRGDALKGPAVFWEPRALTAEASGPLNTQGTQPRSCCSDVPLAGRTAAGPLREETRAGSPLGRGQAPFLKRFMFSDVLESTPCRLNSPQHLRPPGRLRVPPGF